MPDADLFGPASDDLLDACKESLAGEIGGSGIFGMRGSTRQSILDSSLVKELKESVFEGKDPEETEKLVARLHEVSGKGFTSKDLLLYPYHYLFQHINSPSRSDVAITPAAQLLTEEKELLNESEKEIGEVSVRAP